MDMIHRGVSLGNEVFGSVRFCSFGHFPVCWATLHFGMEIVAFTELLPYPGKDSMVIQAC